MCRNPLRDAAGAAVLPEPPGFLAADGFAPKAGRVGAGATGSATIASAPRLMTSSAGHDFGRWDAIRIEREDVLGRNRLGRCCFPE